MIYNIYQAKEDCDSSSIAGSKTITLEFST